MLSALKNERVIASQIYPSPALPKDISHAFIANLQGALFASKLVSYAQGFAMMRAAAKVLFFTITSQSHSEISLEPTLWGNRPELARGLHYSISLFESNQASI